MDRLPLSEKEKDIIQDVQRKNFWGRALPLSIGSMMGCRYLMYRGSISANRSFAKVFGFGFAGYVLGRMSIPRQVRERLLKDCPDGIFAKMNQEFAQLTPEEKKAFMAELSANMKKKVGEVNQTSPGVVTESTGTESRTETPMYMGSSGSVASSPSQQPVTDRQSTFSYAEQRAKWSNSQTGIPQPPPSPPPPPSTQQPEFSYAQQRSLHSGGNVQQAQNIPQDTQSLPPQGLSSPPAGTGRKVKRNIYGDEME